MKLFGFCTIAMVMLAALVTAEDNKFKMFKKVLEHVRPSGDEVSYYLLTESLMNWFDALSLCKNFDMDLAILETEEEEIKLLSKLDGTGIQSYIFLGGADIGDSNQWYWVKTGQPIRQNMRWGPNEPDSLEQHVMLFYKSGSKYFVGNTFSHYQGYPLCQHVTENDNLTPNADILYSF